MFAQYAAVILLFTSSIYQLNMYTLYFLLYAKNAQIQVFEASPF